MNLIVLGAFLLAAITFANGQNLCKFSSTPSQSGFSFINNFSTNKCLRVANFGHFSDSKIFIDECSWWKSATKDQLFSTTQSKSISDGTIFTADAGLDEKYCVTTIDGALHTSRCREASLDSVWRIKPIRGQENQVLIQQVSSSKCIMPKTRATRSTILLVPCNSYQTEQIWKLCPTTDNSTTTATRTPVPVPSRRA